MNKRLEKRLMLLGTIWMLFVAILCQIAFRTAGLNPIYMILAYFGCIIYGWRWLNL